jgi:hypothetical protein
MIPPKFGCMMVTGFVIVKTLSLASLNDVDDGVTLTNACVVGVLGILQLYVAGLLLVLHELVIVVHVEPLFIEYSIT